MSGNTHKGLTLAGYTVSLQLLPHLPFLKADTSHPSLQERVALTDPDPRLALSRCLQLDLE